MAVLLKFLLGNWKQLLILLAAVSLYSAGRFQGVNAEKAVCEAQLQKMNAQRVSEVAEIQADANAKAAEYEVFRNTSEKNLSTLRESLEDEIKLNPAFNSCHAGSSFLRIYAAATGASSTSKTTR